MPQYKYTSTPLALSESFSTDLSRPSYLGAAPCDVDISVYMYSFTTRAYYRNREVHALWSHPHSHKAIQYILNAYKKPRKPKNEKREGGEVGRRGRRSHRRIHSFIHSSLEVLES